MLSIDVFSKLSHNGGPLSAPWQYIRNVTDGWAYSPTNGYTGDFVPYYDMYDANIRCGRGAARSGPGTQTLTVNAGDELAFFPTIRDQYSNEEKDTDISHEGPGQAYLSKAGDAEGELEAYEGDGDWFKIGSIIAKNETRWALLSAASVSDFVDSRVFDLRLTFTSMNFSIPKSTPPGKYLMRIEHIFQYSYRFNNTQFYVNCAHIDVKGPGGGKLYAWCLSLTFLIACTGNPGPMAKFPGAYDVWDNGKSAIS